MIDLSAVKSQATLLLMGQAITNLPMIGSKANITTQIAGHYSMLFPLIHKNFPLTLETKQAITLALQMHNMTNMHNGLSSSNVPSSVQGQILPIVMESMSKEKIITKADSEVNIIGYGV